MRADGMQIVADMLGARDTADTAQAIGDWRLQEMSSFPTNANPFHHDLYHMGTSVNDRFTVMYDGHGDYLIIVDGATGKRLRVAIERK